ncbi:MAG: capsule biosynthesis protein [Rhodobacteraceae bacterium]|nr:capsule biosynthesis protein [Paracoccaceae bacterium]
MTTKPKARKFRIKRSDAVAPTGETRRAAAMEGARPQRPTTPPEDLLAAPTRPEDGFGDRTFPGAATHRPEAEAAAEANVEQELAAIRAEGLTGRQLRMARRTAQKHGLQPSSDFDAVRLLRNRGIEPFDQAGMLELVVNDAGKAAGAAGVPARQVQSGVPAQPRPAPPPPAAPKPQPALTADERAAEIMKVQRDIARRRRRRLVLLAARLAVFVFLPTFIVGFYYYRVATPLYATHTEFIIQKADSGAASGGGGLGGLLGGSSFATVQESITVQSFLESREAMLRLDQDLGFRSHFSSPEIDPLVRLEPEASVEDVYATYRQQLTIGYDPTEGVVRLEMLAADPQVSQAFSEALLTYAEERVDQMSQRLREDQMAGARDSFEDAERRVVEAQQRVLALQERRGVLSAEAEVSAVFGQINTFELELQNERLRLDELLSVARPNETRVEVAERNIARLEALIEELRSGLVDTQGGDASLAQVQSELIVAQADLETRQMMLAQALQQMEAARVEANRQSLYLSLAVFPIAPDEAAYPKAFENTLLAFLIFSGIYLLISMTVSILREQVSS